MEIKLALSGHPFRGWEPAKLLDLAVERLRITALDYWPWNRGDMTPDAFRRLAEAKGAAVAVVNVPGSSGRLGAPGDEGSFEAALLEGISEAEALRAPFVQFYAGTPRWADRSTAPRILAELLKPLADRAHRSGVTLLIENNLDQRAEAGASSNPSRTADMILSLVEMIGPSLQVCFDPCNFHAVGEEAFPHSYRLLAPHIANVHAKDCRRYIPWLDRREPNADHLLTDSIHGAFLPVPLGQGAVNWDGIFRRLELDSYSGWLTLDPFCSEDQLTNWCDASAPFLHAQVAPH